MLGVIRIKGPSAASPWRSMATAAGVISIRAWARCTPSRSCAQGSLCRSNAYRAPTALNFGNPEKRTHVAVARSRITKACEELDTPITGGNVSFYNETLAREFIRLRDRRGGNSRRCA